jgi:type I restriction enzyme S subunit
MNADELLRHYERVADAPEAVPLLRRFVLELAVRGKLAEQAEADEPAAALVRRIASEKFKASAPVTGKAVSVDLQLGGSGPYELPSSWIWVPLGAVVVSHVGGGTPSKSNAAYWGGSIPWASVKDIGKAKYVAATLDSITPEGLASSSSKMVEPNSLIVVTRMGLGKLSINTIPMAINQDLRALTLSGLVSIDFIYNFFRTHQYEGSGLTVKGIRVEELLGTWLPLPPLAEQHRIVAKVDELMALCDRLEAARAEREAARDRLTAASLARLNAPNPETFAGDARFALDALPAIIARPHQVDRLRQTILNLAVRGKLVQQNSIDEPPPIREAGQAARSTGRLDVELPSNWRWARLSNVAEARLGKMLDKAKNSGRQYPYLRNTNVHWFEVRLDDIKTIPLEDRELGEYRLVDGDVLICEGGHGIGRTAVWRGGVPNMVFQKALHRVRTGERLDPDFFSLCCFVYFDAGIMQTYFTGVGIPHFTGRALAQLVFPLPPIAEQRRIVAKVGELMALCDQLEASLTMASEYQRRLLETALHETLYAGELEMVSA